jgi:molybdopterin synthase sulfur carrier subunit
MDQSDTTQTAAPSVHARTVTVLYFARLREALGRDSERLALPPSAQTVDRLRQHLRSRGGVWETELASNRPVRVAVNQDIAVGDMVLSDGDEVAFFPPVTGG